ncbi:MAG: insulinase family protein [Geobacteraceae bacterium]|nr:insulinase family protein [Geobacteraceae bacterium]
MVHETTFDNGLRVVTQQVPGMHTVSIGVWVANGARCEQPVEQGVAHFIEHLLFKGTKRRTARQITREIDSLGGILNAFTSYEYVCYYAKALAKTLPQVVDILSDMFLHSTFPADEIEKERKVVLQEIKMRDDAPEESIHDRLHQSFWKGHPLGHPILGSEETIGSMSRDAILHFRQHWYRPSEIIIAAAGGVEHQALVELLQESFSCLESGEPRRVVTPQTRQATGRVLELCERDLEQTLICLGTEGLPTSSPERYSLMVLNAILGGGMSSRLFEEIREKRGLAYSVYSYVSSFADAGSMAIYAGSERERSCEAVKIILGEMARLRDELVPQDELEAAREQIKGKILMSLESSDSYMSRLARSYLNFGRYQPLDEVMAGFDAVTAADLGQLATRLFRDETLNIQVMGKVDPQCFTEKSDFIAL